MITDEMVEAACVGIHGHTWKIFGDDRKDFFRSEQRRAFEAAEPLTPKMVKIAEVRGARGICSFSDMDWKKIDALPFGTKIYAELPAGHDTEGPAVE